MCIMEECLHNKKRICDLVGEKEKVKKLDNSKKCDDEAWHIVAIDKCFQQVESKGQGSSWQQSLEDFDHAEVWGLRIHFHTPNKQHYSEFSSKQEYFSEY